MFKKVLLVSLFMALAASYTVFSQVATLNTAIANAVREISPHIPARSRIAVVNITSESANLSGYVINELIVNFINTGRFQVASRSDVELQLAQGEFNFQAGYVNIEDQSQHLKFLRADTIISGTITRDSATTYRLVVNAILHENFTYQHVSRVTFRDDQQVKTLIAASDFKYDNDFTFQQRMEASALNLLFGAGSFAIQKDVRGGKVTAIFEGVGAVAMITGEILYQAFDASWTDNLLDSYFAYPFFIGLGSYIGGAVYGIIRAQMYTRPGTKTAINDFPFNLELVSSNNRDMNGLRITYCVKF